MSKLQEHFRCWPTVIYYEQHQAESQAWIFCMVCDMIDSYVYITDWFQTMNHLHSVWYEKQLFHWIKTDYELWVACTVCHMIDISK